MQGGRCGGGFYFPMLHAHSLASLDLLQVDLLTAKQPTASDEVARGRLVSLAGFSFAFRAKNGEWRDSHLGFQVSFASPWLQWRNVLIPLRPNLLNVYVYLHHRRSKFVYCVRKLTTSGGRKKTKTCFNLESILGKEISSDCFLTNILCRNCADKNETLVRKLHGVRESLQSSRKAITEEKGGITSIKRQARDSDHGTSEQKSNKRAMFVSRDDPPSTDNSIAALRCNDTSGFRRFPWGREYFNRSKFEKKEYSRLHVLSCYNLLLKT